MPKKIKALELDQFSLFRHLEAEEKADVALRLERRFLGAKKTLLAYGQTGSGVYFLRRGQAKVCVPTIGDDEGREAILNICGRGEVLGEIDAINGKGHLANVVTLSQSDLWWMPTTCFRTCLVQYPKLSLALNEILAERLQRLSAQDSVLTTLALEGRLARQILLLACDFGAQTQKGIAIPVHLAQRDLAALVGSTREQVNRTLSKFRRRGLLQLDSDGCFVIRDCHVLHTYCAGCMDHSSLLNPPLRPEIDG